MTARKIVISFSILVSIELIHIERKEKRCLFVNLQDVSQLPQFTIYVGQLSFPLRDVNIEIRIRESVKVALGQAGVQCGDHE